ncbi:hypothetical protein O7606_09465 [Micromonospora sp. WMMD882]|uniref:endonuclease domain-containing protein n=1 Tax=Micromonospora sp. WMMD882 TaxID=3015151 RepID=UPI00248B9C54|nr:hypothetical protein [Micromonospora sp. WMMD882]WBB81561.1 hypothetical protein O7606_09465 [Micromonospora sp. WMMD882]
MPTPARRPPELRGRIFRGSTAIADGLLTRNELRSSAWRPLFRDVYADAGLTVTHRQRCAVVSQWLLPPEAAVAGPAAAALHGAGQVTPDDPIDVLAPAGVRVGSAAGLRVHRAAVTPDDIIVHAESHGVASASPHHATGGNLHRAAGGTRHPSVLGAAPLRVTSPVRTCWDVARWLPPVEAVVVVDALLARRSTSRDALRGYALDRAGDRGWRALLRVVDLADPGAESPQESRTRVRLVQAGLPRPVTQHVITRGGRFVARVDLAWPEFRVAVEYDGLWHDDPEQFHRDRRRLNQLVGDDWIVLHLTGKRLREDFDGFLAEVRAALRSRAPRP